MQSFFYDLLLSVTIGAFLGLVLAVLMQFEAFHFLDSTKTILVIGAISASLALGIGHLSRRQNKSAEPQHTTGEV